MALKLAFVALKQAYTPVKVPYVPPVWRLSGITIQLKVNFGKFGTGKSCLDNMSIRRCNRRVINPMMRTMAKDEKLRGLPESLRVEFDSPHKNEEL